MKPLRSLLVVCSLIAAVIGAMTAYLPRLSLPDEALAGLTLNSPAGVREGAGGPIGVPGTPLTPDLLAALRAAGVERIRVREFAIGRWSEWWLFGLGVLGLVAGGVWGRRAARAAASTDTRGSLAGAAEVLSRIRATVGGLLDDAASPADAFLPAVIERLGRTQRDDVPSFIAARDSLVAASGLAGYARIMDRFAAAERQMNRAWSAAADGYSGGIEPALRSSAELLAAAAERLDEIRSSGAGGPIDSGPPPRSDR